MTISEKVYDASTGEFLGNFGIDFFMDKLVNILGDSYSENSYAFLADSGGDIINHPFGSYQMTTDKKTNVSDLPYSSVETDRQETRIIKDYDGRFKVITAAAGREAGFIVYVVASIESIYGKVFDYGLACFICFMICIIMV